MSQAVNEVGEKETPNPRLISAVASPGSTASKTIPEGNMEELASDQ